MISDEVIYSYRPPVDSKQFIDIESGEVCSFDQASKHIVKISSRDIAVVGKMSGSFRTEIVWVDKATV